MEALFSSAIVCCGAPANSESEYVFASWNVEQGLPQHTVKALCQTRDGFLWVGTYNGLSRFDGLRFTTFNSANTPALRFEDITALFKDRAGRLWIGTDHGIVRFENGKFTVPAAGLPLQDAYITEIRELPDGSMCIATDQGVFQQVAGQFQEVPIPKSSWPTRHTLLAVGLNSEIWITHRTALYRWIDGTLQLRAELPSAIVNIFRDSENRLWCALIDDRIFTFKDDVLTEFTELPTDGLRKQSFYQSRDGDLWIGTSDGVFRRRNGILHAISKKNGLPGNVIKIIFEDSTGNIWIGTSGEGLVRLRKNRIQTYSTRNGLNSDDTVSILEDRDGAIWVGTFEGRESRLDQGSWQSRPVPGLPNALRHVVSLCQTRDQSLWLGTYGDGVFRLRGQHLDHIILTNEVSVRAMFEDCDGGLWVGSSKAGVFHLKGERTEQYSLQNGLSLNFVTSIAQDSSGAIWVGTENGLNQISNGKVRQFFKTDGLGANMINGLLADGSGMLWIATMGGGLTRLKEGRFATVTTADGLAQDAITQIIEDDLGNLWMGSRVGIFRAAKRNLSDVVDGKAKAVYCTFYSKTDGLQSVGFVPGFQPSCMKARDGCLWFCGSGGLSVIDPKQMIHDESPVPVFIESVLADGEEVLAVTSSSASKTSRNTAETSGEQIREPRAGRLRIAPDARRLEFRFTGLDFSAPERLQFRCKLEGYDDDWQYVGTRRAAYYTRVPPGQYLFRVSTALGNAEENLPEAALSFTVLTPFRQTWWFRGLLVSFSAIILISFYRLRVRHAREVEQVRWRIASDLHDEVGSNLSNIALLAHLGQTAPPNSDRPRAEFGEINRVAVETANAVRDLVWFIDPECDTLAELVQQMEALASRSLPPGMMDFESRLESSEQPLSLLFRRNVLLLFKETIHNVLKHAKAQHVQIKIEEKAGVVDLLVRDDGIGFTLPLSKRGHGLKSLRRRADDIRGSLSIESRPGEGTEVRLIVKVS